MLVSLQFSILLNPKHISFSKSCILCANQVSFKRRLFAMLFSLSPGGAWHIQPGVPNPGKIPQHDPSAESAAHKAVMHHPFRVDLVFDRCPRGWEPRAGYMSPFQGEICLARISSMPFDELPYAVRLRSHISSCNGQGRVYLISTQTEGCKLIE